MNLVLKLPRFSLGLWVVKKRCNFKIEIFLNSMELFLHHLSSNLPSFLASYLQTVWLHFRSFSSVFWHFNSISDYFPQVPPAVSSTWFPAASSASATSRCLSSTRPTRCCHVVSKTRSTTFSEPSTLASKLSSYPPPCPQTFWKLPPDSWGNRFESWLRKKNWPWRVSDNFMSLSRGRSGNWTHCAICTKLWPSRKLLFSAIRAGRSTGWLRRCIPVISPCLPW